MQENLLEEDIPPKWMWPFDEEMEHWFKVADERRNNGGEAGDEEEYEENLFARGMKD